MKKTWMNIVSYAGVLIGVLIIAGIADGRMKQRPCAGVKPVIRNHQGNYFLDERKVQNLVWEAHGAMIENETVGKISIAGIEQNPNIDFSSSLNC